VKHELQVTRQALKPASAQTSQPSNQ